MPINSHHLQQEFSELCTSLTHRYFKQNKFWELFFFFNLAKEAQVGTYFFNSHSYSLSKSQEHLIKRLSKVFHFINPGKKKKGTNKPVLTTWQAQIFPPQLNFHPREEDAKTTPVNQAVQAPGSFHCLVCATPSPVQNVARAQLYILRRKPAGIVPRRNNTSYRL